MYSNFYEYIYPMFFFLLLNTIPQRIYNIYKHKTPNGRRNLRRWLYTFKRLAHRGNTNFLCNNNARDSIHYMCLYANPISDSLVQCLCHANTDTSGSRIMFKNINMQQNSIRPAWIRLINSQDLKCKKIRSTVFNLNSHKLL